MLIKLTANVRVYDPLRRKVILHRDTTVQPKVIMIAT